MEKGLLILIVYYRYMAEDVTGVIPLNIHWLCVWSVRQTVGPLRIRPIEEPIRPDLLQTRK
jgi:hypothetical protein